MLAIITREKYKYRLYGLRNIFYRAVRSKSVIVLNSLESKLKIAYFFLFKKKSIFGRKIT